MSYWLTFAALVGGFVAGGCQIDKAADRQMRGYIRDCHCACVLVEASPDLFQSFTHTYPGVLHEGERAHEYMWSGHIAVCLRPDEEHVEQRYKAIQRDIDEFDCARYGIACRGRK